ncbi:hypothetical protein N658DRAFT_482858 [Parathielavia hyrcaniae]|uniref:Uncharacterized protein n=1 Tax=Parathielavia hyrcaniae TaxID=113614 RepID=A0AAN6QD72_9PEZI|nr:hypothetical protein N658DRAFT_482858 [Parathielavia hyrcaniae]
MHPNILLTLFFGLAQAANSQVYETPCTTQVTATTNVNHAVFSAFSPTSAQTTVTAGAPVTTSRAKLVTRRQQQDDGYYDNDDWASKRKVGISKAKEYAKNGRKKGKDGQSKGKEASNGQADGGAQRQRVAVEAALGKRDWKDDVASARSVASSYASSASVYASAAVSCASVASSYKSAASVIESAVAGVESLAAEAGADGRNNNREDANFASKAGSTTRKTSSVKPYFTTGPSANPYFTKAPCNTTSTVRPYPTTGSFTGAPPATSVKPYFTTGPSANPVCFRSHC